MAGKNQARTCVLNVLALHGEVMALWDGTVPCTAADY